MPTPTDSFLPLSEARTLYADLEKADSQSKANDRAEVTRMFDGEPPYTKEQLDRAKLNGICNVNFGDGETALEQGMQAYVDLLQSVDDLVTGEIEFGDPTQRLEWGKAIFAEVSRTIRAWPEHFLQFLLNSTYFIGHGVSFTLFPDPVTWKFEAVRLGDILLPKRTKATESAISFFFWRKDVEDYELEAIAQSRMAASAGWNVDAVRRLLESPPDKKDATHEKDPERAAEDRKNKDYDVSGRSRSYRLIHFFARNRRTLKVDHYVFPDQSLPRDSDKLPSSEEKEEYLFVKQGEYDQIGECLTAFIWGVGTNGHFDNIRGLGARIFPLIQTINRMDCRGVDAAAVGSQLLIQPTDDASASAHAIVNRGPVAIVGQGYSVVERAAPNLAGSVFPVSDRMRQRLGTKTTAFSPHDALPDSREMSRFEVSARLEQAASLSVTALTLFYTHYDKLMRAMVKRMLRKSYPESWPGGDAIKLMRARLKRAGVPDEAIASVDFSTVQAKRAVGAGSPSYRAAVFQQLGELAAGMDELGRKNLLRDRAAALLGSYQLTDRYLPDHGQPRPPIDAKVAILENGSLLQGNEVPVMPNELHLTHIENHARPIQQLLEAVENGEQDLLDVTPGMVALHQHATQHLELLAGDPMASADINFYRQFLQQAGEIIVNGLRAMEAARRKGEVSNEQAGQPSPEESLRLQKLQIDIATAQAKLEVMLQKHQTEMAIKVSQAQSESAIREAEAAAKLRPAAPSMGRSLTPEV